MEVWRVTAPLLVSGTYIKHIYGNMSEDRILVIMTHSIQINYSL